MNLKNYQLNNQNKFSHIMKHGFIMPFCKMYWFIIWVILRKRAIYLGNLC